MQALICHRPSPAWMLMRHPALWLLTAAATATTSILAGALGALAVLGGTVGSMWAALRSGRVRGWLERSAQREALRMRREAREIRIEDAGVRRHGLADATALVDQITAAAPQLAAHLELEGLLDRYVELELVAARCSSLLDGRAGTRNVPERSATRALIRDRSVALRRTCEAQLAAAREELESIVELLRLLVERSALDGTELDGDPVGERMALLDD